MEFEKDKSRESKKSSSRASFQEDSGLKRDLHCECKDYDSELMQICLFNEDNERKSLESEFRINDYSSDQIKHSSVKLNDDGFIISWINEGQDSSYLGIYAQMYNIDGTKKMDEFQIDTDAHEDLCHTSVESLSEGEFAVTWENNGQDGSGAGVYAQMYNANVKAINDSSLNDTIKIAIGTASVALFTFGFALAYKKSKLFRSGCDFIAGLCGCGSENNERVDVRLGEVE